MKRFLMILVAMAFAGCSFGYTPPSKASDMAGDTLADSQDSNDGDSDDETNFNPPLPVEDEPLPDLADVATNTDSTDMPDTDTPANTDSDVDNGLDVAEPKADALDTLAETETMIVPPCVVNPLLCADTPPTLLDAEVATTEPTTAEQPMAESNASESAMVEFATVEPTVAVELATAESIATVEFGADAETTADTSNDTVDTATAKIETIVVVPSDTGVKIDAQTEEVAVPTETAPNADTVAENEIISETAPPVEDTLAQAETTTQPDGSISQPCVSDPTLCDDNNPCTDDFCDTETGCTHTNNTIACDDGNQCTANDACENSVCAPGTAVVCDDSDACTDDYCQNGVGCVYEWVCECVVNAKCDDQNPCTNDVCAAGFCKYLFNSAPCDDNSACTATDQCVGGECMGIVPLNCDDNNQCTFDACDPAVGCSNSQMDGSTCDDDDACTKIDSCQKDVCVGETIVCNDNNPCTDDSCDQKNGCVYTPNNNNPCEDGSLCTIGDFCDAGKCQAGKELKCDDGNICTDNVCQTLKGCIYPANQAGCDDGNGCTVGDICADIACVSGTNICQCATDADCVGAEDNNLCNGTLVCDTAVMPHKCIVNQDTIITCNTTSDTACSKNTCQPKSGKCEMTAVNESGACNDDNACTSGDICSNGICSGTSVKCEDSNVCTDDSCDPATGCVFAPNSEDCSSDFNECTNDVCQNSQCAHLPITDGADCDDGSVCTIIDACKQSKCVGTAPLDCDDNNECTLDVCNKTLGCQHSKPPMNGKACDNGDACTVNDTCQSGACQAGTQTCDCYTTPDCASKEDGDLCNGTLVCDTAIMPHKCVLDPTSVITCPTAADTVCIKNTCQPASGKCEMEAVNEGKTCAEGQCLAEATCQSGQCAVVNKPDGTECDDGQSCNSDSCQSGICVDMPFASANFDTGALDAGWQITNFATPYKINGTQGYTSSPNSLVFAGNGTDAWAVLTSPTFSLQSGHTATLTFDHTTGQGGTQSFAVQIHTASGAATLLEKTNAFLLPWTHYILPLDNYNGEVWLTFHFTGAYIFEAIDSISVGCP